MRHLCRTQLFETVETDQFVHVRLSPCFTWGVSHRARKPSRLRVFAFMKLGFGLLISLIGLITSTAGQRLHIPSASIWAEDDLKLAVLESIPRQFT